METNHLKTPPGDGTTIAAVAFAVVSLGCMFLALPVIRHADEMAVIVIPPAWASTLLFLLIPFLGGGRLLYRLALSAAIGAALMTALVLGWFAAFDVADWQMEHVRQDFVVTMLVIPSVVLVTGSPLILFRSIFCWRIQNEDQTRGEEHRQWSIQSILLLTAVVAACVAMLRAAAELQGEADFLWFVLPIFGGVLATVNLLTVPPSLIAVLRGDRLGPRLVMLAIYATFLVIGPATLVGGRAAAPIAFVATYFGTLVAGLSIARAAGYRLHWGWKRMTTATLQLPPITPPQTQLDDAG